MKIRLIMLIILLFTISVTIRAQKNGSFTDYRDGKTYSIVNIWGQTWMGENLAFKANSGCWAYENNEEYARVYGYLYNWEAASNSCPAGWRLPTNEDWELLSKNLTSHAGDQLKEAGTEHWRSPNQGAINNFGFTALPGGYREYDGTFKNRVFHGYWWSSTPLDQSSYWYWTLHFDNSGMYKAYALTTAGFAVRCIKNQ